MDARNGEAGAFADSWGVMGRQERLEESAQSFGSLHVREIDRIGDPNKGKLEFWKPGM